MRLALGRAYLDDGKPSLASIAFYDNYKKYPDGERAPERDGADERRRDGDVLRRAQAEPDLAQLFGEVDVLVDGPFLLARRTLALAWRGSDNQRLIDVPASLAAGTAVEWEENSTVESMQRQR